MVVRAGRDWLDYSIGPENQGREDQPDCTRL